MARGPNRRALVNVQVKVKKYANSSAANRDAQRMAADGWEPQGMTGGGTRLSLGKGIANKSLASAALGPLGIFASSRTEQPVTITCTRTSEAAAEAQQRRQEYAAVVARSDEARRSMRADRRAAKQEQRLRHKAAKQKTAVVEETVAPEVGAAELAIQRDHVKSTLHPAATATVVLYRNPDVWGDRNRRYKILIDGQNTGYVLYGKRTTLQVPAGEHRVAVKIDFMRSNELTVLPNDGDVVELACSGRGLRRAIFRWDGYLDLHHMTPEERARSTASHTQ
jgi:hypothetical protein